MGTIGPKSMAFQKDLGHRIAMHGVGRAKIVRTFISEAICGSAKGEVRFCAWDIIKIMPINFCIITS